MMLGKYYTVVGVGLVISDSCGNTDMTYGGSGVATPDLCNWVSGSVSIRNWAPSDRTLPLDMWFLEPDGVHNLLVQRPFDSLYLGEVQIYPGAFSMAGLYLQVRLSCSIQVQPPAVV
jgi:hypothetical protein